MSLQPEKHPDQSSGLTTTSQPERGEFSSTERTQLLRVAHQSIETALQNRNISVEPSSPHLAERRGVFTTLYRRGELRGCVGYVFPIMPLYQAVAETARAAAFDDTRFLPVSCEETSELQVSLSVLSALQPVQPEDVEVGRHGLVVTLGSNRGLLLPQVPVEHHWDRIAFLEQTCRKAGLPLDAWRKGATLEAFTAEVFGDEGLH
jgi:AmmeMemoRadiSam system protein A